MFAIIAIIAFSLALIFHLVGGGVAADVLTAELAGFICLALHLASGTGWTWPAPRRPGP